MPILLKSDNKFEKKDVEDVRNIDNIISVNKNNEQLLNCTVMYYNIRHITWKDNQSCRSNHIKQEAFLGT